MIIVSDQIFWFRHPGRFHHIRLAALVCITKTGKSPDEGATASQDRYSLADVREPSSLYYTHLHLRDVLQSYTTSKIEEHHGKHRNLAV